MKHAFRVQYNFSRKSHGFRDVQTKHLFVVPLHNSKTIGLILIILIMGTLVGQLHVFYAAYKTILKVRIYYLKQ